MDLIKIIDTAIINQPPDPIRPYIGASSIGNDCKRAIWYSYHNIACAPYTAKQKRTFEIGKRLEDMVLDYIELAGFKLVRGKPGTPGIPCQDEELEFFSGHMDGLLYLSDTHIVALELKTAKESEFKKFVNDGVKAWKPSYYAQVQSYMGMKKLQHAVIFVICKNTSAWHCEWIEYDDIFFHELRIKAAMIAETIEPPDKINNNPCYYICQMCKYKEHCHNPGTVEHE